MAFIKKNYMYIILVLALVLMVNSLYNTYERNKVNNKLFDAYVKSIEVNNRQLDLINKQIEYINGLTNVLKERQAKK